LWEGPDAFEDWLCRHAGRHVGDDPGPCRGAGPYAWRNRQNHGRLRACRGGGRDQRATFAHSSGDWKKWLVDYSRAHGVSATRQIDLVQARYRKRARVLGGDEAHKDMLRRARSCDKRLAGL